MEEALATDQTESDQPQSQASDKQERDRSSIRFPYLPLEDAVTIAKGVHELGTKCEIDQLAAKLGQKPDTGSFRLKLITAKMFGLTSHSLGTVTLTELGSRVCDSQREQEAKAEAFLTIPLYQRVYEQFKGGVLPPPSGLESAMVDMGVAPKQKATARQVFHRSANSAGFFWSGAGRLVYPVIKGSGGTGSPAAETTIDPKRDQGGVDRNRNNGGNDGGDGGGLPPFIKGLVDSLPPQNTAWPLEKRAKWLQTAASAFNLMYEDVEGSIEIKVQKGAAQ